MKTKAINDLFCQACKVKRIPESLETLLALLTVFCRTYKFDWQFTHLNMSYFCIIIPTSGNWMVEEPGSTPREAIVRAVVAVYDNMQKSTLSTVIDFNSQRKEDNNAN